MSDNDVQKKQRDNVLLTIIGVLLFAFACVGLFYNKISTPRVLSEKELRNNGAIVFEKPRIFGDVSLTDHNGEPFDSDRLKGKWSILLFGFTFCPDICPTALAQLNSMVEPLSEEELADLQVVMISVDPERDTSEVLSQYVPYFNESFTGVTGNPHFIRKLAAELNVAYNKVPLEATEHREATYTMDHSAHLVLVNPYGHYHGFFRHPQDPTEMRLTWRSIRESFKG
ncbi:SCO family protein [Porticoccus sp. W117]|uniref:SCO family protein n=1 Tax=Porticoccus sp. W117 TaxID=3054777 RepID=UPI0025989D66|nr:SCO family protein [Porticoccus sp. W117]MDM3870811.1 SCO family protein [Porticoccus sp. W117]